METKIKLLRKIRPVKSDFKKLPQTPGVYIFWQKDSPIYIGKAINLKSRLSSYLASYLSLKTKRMVEEANFISFIQVSSELESLLLEAFLIHKHKPRYNSAAKDDKHPLYIKITKEKYPRVVTARKIQLTEPSLAFFGPFPSSKTVYSVLKMLRRIFPFSDHKLGKRACIYSHIGLCNPCPNQIEATKDPILRETLRKKYLLNISRIKKVLSRRLGVVTKDLYKAMNKLSSQEKYEEAAGVREQIKRLEYITQPVNRVSEFIKNPNLIEDIRSQELSCLKKLLEKHIKLKSVKRIECFDVAHIAGSSPTASMVTFIDGEADKNLYRHFRIRQKKGQDDIASLKEVAKRRLNYIENWGKPNLIIVDGGKGQVGVFSEVFEKTDIPVVGLAKRFETLVIPKKEGFLDIRVRPGPCLNLTQRVRDEAHRFARRYHHLLFKKSLIGVS